MKKSIAIAALLVTAAPFAASAKPYYKFDSKYADIKVGQVNYAPITAKAAAVSIKTHEVNKVSAEANAIANTNSVTKKVRTYAKDFDSNVYQKNTAPVTAIADVPKVVKYHPHYGYKKDFSRANIITASASAFGNADDQNLKIKFSADELNTKQFNYAPITAKASAIGEVDTRMTVEATAVANSRNLTLKGYDFNDITSFQKNTAPVTAKAKAVALESGRHANIAATATAIGNSNSITIKAPK